MSTATTAPFGAAYTIDPSHSSAGFKVRHLMISYVRGGFAGITGDVVFDTADPANTRINASIDVNTLHTHDPKRDERIKGSDLLDAAQYPTITFVSKAMVADGKDQWKITGDLTLHGVTKEVTLDVESSPAEAKDPFGKLRRGASATTTIKRSDFGMTLHVPLETGGVVLGDEVRIHLDIEGLRKE